MVVHAILRMLHREPPVCSSQCGTAAKHRTDIDSSATAATRPGRRTRVIRWYASTSSRRRESATTPAATRMSPVHSHQTQPGRAAAPGAAPAFRGPGSGCAMAPHL
ncbi:hypothetical protein M878_01915 [Streptomyces roseochromogenus subsp. oscitans DS 12.976]|uniref:Uncharacterized protein n=1 Tax=Streptomyces roseochromogenus subsp. oscitans DS 12.976 TaxID=1352936 RepID=V6KWB8_STRRC|nr:hypothetical protein M878_01915 [Streptomyces roseochromogenus subsp. oscitans DS 12.976]